MTDCLPRIVVTREQASDLLDSLNVLGKQGTTVNTTEQPTKGWDGVHQVPIAPGDEAEVGWLGQKLTGKLFHPVAVGTVADMAVVYDGPREGGAGTVRCYVVTLTDLAVSGG